MKINKTIISAGLLITGLSMFSVPQAKAQTHCYRFDNQTIGTQFDVGQTIDTQHADINVLKFINGVNIGDALVVDYAIIDDAQPSLRIAAATVQIIPDSRVQSVTFRYAENAPAGNPQGWNLGVNDKLLEWRGTLSEQDGEALGKLNHGGRVSVSVTSVPSSNSNWIEGTRH